MFVGVIEIMKDGQRIVGSDISPIRVLVGLNPFNNALGAPGDSLYHSSFNGRFEFLRGETDGELNFKVRRLMAGGDKRPDQVILTRSKMMDNLSDQH